MASFHLAKVDRKNVWELGSANPSNGFTHPAGRVDLEFAPEFLA